MPLENGVPTLNTSVAAMDQLQIRPHTAALHTDWGLDGRSGKVHGVKKLAMAAGDRLVGTWRGRGDSRPYRHLRARCARQRARDCSPGVRLVSSDQWWARGLNRAAGCKSRKS